MESRVQDFSEVNPKKVSTISLSLYHLYMSIIYMYISSLSSLSIYIYNMYNVLSEKLVSRLLRVRSWT